MSLGVFFDMPQRVKYGTLLFMRCPICKSAVPEAGPHRPFCSSRCKRIDLGNWLTGVYRISRPLNEDEVEAVLRVDGGESGDEVN